MTPRRRLGSVACLMTVLAALTACERPTPLVTVVNAGKSVYAEADTYCFEGQSTVEANCAVRRQSTPTLEVVSGEPVGVDVGKELVEGGWFIELSDPQAPAEEAQPQQSEVQDDHYFTFTAPNLPPEASLLLTVRSLDGETPNGQWSFLLVRR